MEGRPVVEGYRWQKRSSGKSSRRCAARKAEMEPGSRSEEQQASVAVRCAWSASVPKHAERRAELGTWCRAGCRDAGRQRGGLRELCRGLLASKRATSRLEGLGWRRASLRDRGGPGTVVDARQPRRRHARRRRGELHGCGRSRPPAPATARTCASRLGSHHPPAPAALVGWSRLGRARTPRRRLRLLELSRSLAALPNTQPPHRDHHAAVARTLRGDRVVARHRRMDRTRQPLGGTEDVSAGTAWWLAIGAIVALWIALSARVSWIPTIAEIGRAWSASWAGRIVLAAAWAELGWHLFCQRP